LWDADGVRGVTDDAERARQAAEACIRRGQATTARVEKALALPGTYTLIFDYHRTGIGWVTQRSGDGRVLWARIQELAAS
jgi:hypothetical protein